MGVSGIASRLWAKPSKDWYWRLAFIAGLVSGGFLYTRLNSVDVVIDATMPMVIVAGVLVGVGTVLGNGCTSGHGICGNARFSKRSFVATLVFMTAGILTVLIKRALGF